MYKFINLVGITLLTFSLVACGKSKAERELEQAELNLKKIQMIGDWCQRDLNKIRLKLYKTAEYYDKMKETEESSWDSPSHKQFMIKIYVDSIKREFTSYPYYDTPFPEYPEIDENGRMTNFSTFEYAVGRAFSQEIDKCGEYYDKMYDNLPGLNKGENDYEI